MEELDPRELSQLLKKPVGSAGLQVAGQLNKSNASLYEMVWDVFEPRAGDNLLEIGFGNGDHFRQYFEKQDDLRVNGLDFSKTMCKEAARRNPTLMRESKLSIHCADSSDMPYPDNSFDWVVGLNVVYFWDPPEDHLREILRVLKSGGKFILGIRPRQAMAELPFTQENFTLYEGGELAKLLEESGFVNPLEKTETHKIEDPTGEPIEMLGVCLVAEKA